MDILYQREFFFQLESNQGTDTIILQPILYAFDALMTNEFSTLNGVCSNLVPSGPGYEGISLANQVCPIVGAQPGQDRVNGNRYVELSFEYYLSKLWRVRPLA